MEKLLVFAYALWLILMANLIVLLDLLFRLVRRLWRRGWVAKGPGPPRVKGIP